MNDHKGHSTLSKMAVLQRPRIISYYCFVVTTSLSRLWIGKHVWSVVQLGLFETEGRLKVTGNHVHCKGGRWKWYMVYRTETIPMTLSDLQGHLPTASLFKCDFSYSTSQLRQRVVQSLYDSRASCSNVCIMYDCSELRQRDHRAEDSW